VWLRRHFCVREFYRHCCHLFELRPLMLSVDARQEPPKYGQV